MDDGRETVDGGWTAERAGRAFRPVGGRHTVNEWGSESFCSQEGEPLYSSAFLW